MVQNWHVPLLNEGIVATITTIYGWFGNIPRFDFESVSDWPLRDWVCTEDRWKLFGREYSVWVVARQANPSDEILFSWTMLKNIGTIFTRVNWQRPLKFWRLKPKFLLGNMKTQRSRLTEVLLAVWVIPARSLNEMGENSVSASPIPRLSSLVSSIPLDSWIFLPWNSRRRISDIRLLKSRPSTKVKHRKLWTMIAPRELRSGKRKRSVSVRRNPYSCRFSSHFLDASLKLKFHRIFGMVRYNYLKGIGRCRPFYIAAWCQSNRTNSAG